jgi:hypothetical protein
MQLIADCMWFKSLKLDLSDDRPNVRSEADHLPSRPCHTCILQYELASQDKPPGTVIRIPGTDRWMSYYN